MSRPMLKLTRALAVGLSLTAMLLVASMISTPVSAAKRFIAIGTGGPTGVYFVVGNSVCRMVHKEAAEGRKEGRKHGIRCSAPSTGGFTYNIGPICPGGLGFGGGRSAWQAPAGQGEAPGRRKPV